MQRILIGCAIVFLFAVNSAWGIHFGWQALPEGGIEYIVQVEPDLVDVFRTSGFSSEIPPGLREVRRIRLVMGDQRLPNQDDVNGPSSSASNAVDLRLPPHQTIPQQAAPAQTAVDNSGQIALPAPPVDSREAVVPENSTIAGQPSGNDTTAAVSGGTTSASGAAKSDGGVWGILKILEPGPSKLIPPAETKAENGTNTVVPQDPTRDGMQPSGGSIQPAADAERAGPPAVNQQVKDPRIGNNELAATGSGPASDGFKTFDMKPPSGPDSVHGGSEAAPPRPWLLLMGALLLLFASLGANVYLVWIHQAVRARYRAMVERAPSGMAA
jgi:hypothetical protein